MRSPAALVCLAVALAAGACQPQAREDGRAGAAPVRAEVVKSGPFFPSLTLLGTVRARESAAVAAPIPGLLRYPARFPRGLTTGAEVSEGELLATVENEPARLTLAEARLLFEKADGQLARTKKGYAEGLVSSELLDQHETDARLARERLASAERGATRQRILSPRRGRLVVAQAIPAGSEVAGGTVLAEVASSGAPRVELLAAAADRERLAPGLSVRFRVPGQAEPSGAGRLSEVAATVDAAGTVRVVATVTDPTGLPAPGEGVEALVELARRPDAVTVPEEALVAGASGRAVFLLEKAGMGPVYRARRVAVRTGGRGGGRVEVLEGLRDGDRIAVGGVSFLSDGALAQESRPEGAPGS